MRKLLFYILCLASINASGLDLREYHETEDYIVLRSWPKMGTGGTMTQSYGMRQREDKSYYMAYWSNLIVGSGSGSISVTSQGSLNPGDMILVVAGTYGSGGVISNISGAPGLNITVEPQSGANTVAFTGTLNLINIKYLTFQNFESTATWQMRGNAFGSGGLTGISNVFFSHLHFSGNSSYAFTNYNNVVYNYTTQDTTTEACHKCKWDSITLDNCPGMLQGSFGTVANGIDVCMYDTVTRIVFNNMTTDGAAFIGIQFRSLWAYIAVYQTTVKGYIADNGTFTFGGGADGWNGTIHDVYTDGPISCRITRTNCYALFGSTTDSALYYNIMAADKSTFGGLEIESVPSDWISGKVASCNVAAYNVGLGNCPTLNTYWNYTVDQGGNFSGRTVHIKNCTGWNNAATGKTPGVIIDESGGGITWDTSHNTYAPYATNLKLDTSRSPFPTYKLLAGSPLIGAGIAVPTTTGGQLDLAGNAWAATPSQGPYEYVQACSNCIIKKRAYRTIFQ